MRWILQKDVHAQARGIGLPEALERLGISFELVDVAGGRLDPEPEVAPGERVMTNGSIMLSRIAHERGWRPGSMQGPGFDCEVWSRHYKDLILNKDARVCALRDAEASGRVFARPALDDKSFNGRVFEPGEFAAFQKASLEGRPGVARPDTQVMLSSPKAIGQEHRHYIVDGQAVSSSRYKFAGKPNFREGADQAVLDVVQRAVSIWTPARAFVLDTYVAGEEIGIVEIGGICHAGAYEADLIKLAAALDSMPVDPPSLGSPGRSRFAF